MATAHSTSALPDVRADFPVLEREWNGHRVTYVDSAATSSFNSPAMCSRVSPLLLLVILFLLLYCCLA